jgi:hypothetical protein
MSRQVQLGSKEKKRRFLEEICSAFEKVCPGQMEFLTKVIDDNRKKLTRTSGFSTSGRLRFKTSLPLHFTQFVEQQARKRHIVGPEDRPFFAVHENLQMLFEIWPDLNVGKGPKKFMTDMKKKEQ